MKNYSDQLIKIKQTLDELKNNIEKMQLVIFNSQIYNNSYFQTKEKTLTKSTLKKKYKSLITKRNNPSEEDKNTEIKERNFKTQKINKTYLNNYFPKEKEKEEYTSNNNSISNFNLLRNKKMISTPFLYNTNNDNEINIEEKNSNNIDNDDIILNYKINKIQQEINNIKEKNELLLKNLNNEKEKNISLKSSSKDIEKILIEISKYFEVNNFEEIPNKLTEMINYLSDFNNIDETDAKNEFITNLKELYKKNNNIQQNKNEIINMKILWRWIKYLINSNKKIKNEIDKNSILLQNINKKNIFYKTNCEEIMNIYDIQSLNQFDEFVHGLINKNNIYRRRIEQLKKMLSEDSKNK